MFFFVPIFSLLLFTDDPYYCGLRARIPNFVKKKKKSDAKKQTSSVPPPPPKAPSMINLGMNKPHPFWWHSRLYSDNSGQYSKNPFVYFTIIASLQKITQMEMLNQLGLITAAIIGHRIIPLNKTKRACQ